MELKKKTVECRNYARYDYESMNNDFQRVDLSSLYNLRDVNKALEFFNNTVSSIFNKHAPFINKKVRGKPFNWITPEIRRAMTDRNRILKKARKSNCSRDWNLYRSLRNRCNNRIKSAKATYQRKLLSENSDNPAKFWSCLKRYFLIKPNLPILRTHNVILIARTSSAIIFEMLWIYSRKVPSS